MAKFNIVNQHYYTIETETEMEAFDVADYIRLTSMEGMFPHDITQKLVSEGIKVIVHDYVFEQDRVDDGNLREVIYR